MNNHLLHHHLELIKENLHVHHVLKSGSRIFLKTTLISHRARFYFIDLYDFTKTLFHARFN